MGLHREGQDKESCEPQNLNVLLGIHRTSEFVIQMVRTRLLGSYYNPSNHCLEKLTEL